METTIRKAEPDDLQFVQECAESAYEIYVSRLGKRPAPMVADFKTLIQTGHIDLLCSNTIPVGFAVWYLEDDHLFLQNIALHPDHQGKGLARKIFDHLELTAIVHGKCAIELYTNEKMTENLALYPHLGYQETQRYTQDGFSRVRFRKTLR